MITQRQIFSAAAVGILLMGSVPAMADLTMGVFPRRAVAQTHKMFKPLAQELEKQLGEKVHIKVEKDFKAFWKGVQTGKYDIVHYNQYHYLLSQKKHGYQVIAVNEEMGSSEISGALSVRKDSGINSVSDLKGKTIMFGGGKKAMGSYIAPLAILKKHGLEPGKDFKVMFSKNPPSAVIGVYNNAADAAGSGNVILKIKGVQKKIDTNKMKILAESDTFTHLPWAVKDSMPSAKWKKIQKTMTSLKGSSNGKNILKSASVTGFKAASDKDFDGVRKIVKYAINENL
ncbi:MAG: phosphate/phosphite/phosphonate ABC transporter substrate-binding protein [Gammaproteobacteria bacterium]|nr:phosphate/phosphite/phosphonate ABC transporter substrate-binding protein [Gammaproteobacteria bacterium]